MEVAPVLTWLIEFAPWAATALVLSVGYYLFTKNRNAQAIDLADRAFVRMKDIEARLDIVNEKLRNCEQSNRSKDEEIAYLTRIVHWTSDYVNQLHISWRQFGSEPPAPRYPPPPEPAQVRHKFDNAHH